MNKVIPIYPWLPLTVTGLDLGKETTNQRPGQRSLDWLAAIVAWLPHRRRLLRSIRTKSEGHKGFKEMYIAHQSGCPISRSCSRPDNRENVSGRGHELINEERRF